MLCRMTATIMRTHFKQLMALTGAMILISCPVLRAADEVTFAEIHITSTADGSKQPARWFAPPSQKEPAPLLVVLHTWSGDYRQKGFGDEALVECAKRGWSLIHPNFRGANKKPDACGSDLAVQDVLDAIAWAKTNAKVDDRRIYLVGTSGGGHMTLMMATRSPDTFAGVSSWVPVTDLAAWHGETKAAGRNYWRDCEAVCGGPPGASKAIDAEYRKRSPLFHLADAKGVAIDLNVGIHDGYTGSIPVTHSLLAFNRLAEVNGKSSAKLSDEHIAFMRKQRKVPPALADEREDDGTRQKKVIFRRSAGPARLTVFEGTHEGDTHAAIAWLAKQKK